MQENVNEFSRCVCVHVIIENPYFTVSPQDIIKWARVSPWRRCSSKWGEKFKISAKISSRSHHTKRQVQCGEISTRPLAADYPKLKIDTALNESLAMRGAMASASISPCAPHTHTTHSLPVSAPLAKFCKVYIRGFLLKESSLCWKRSRRRENLAGTKVKIGRVPLLWSRDGGGTALASLFFSRRARRRQH